MTRVPHPCFSLHETVIGSDGAVLAEPLTAEDAEAMGAARDYAFAAPVFVAGEALSTFELGWNLAAKQVLPPWSAIIARTQTGGRGQLRRAWHSPAGNLYVSFFLPPEMARFENLTSLCMGYLIYASLIDMGIPAILKWPNDVLLKLDDPERVGKFGGLLLEERGGRILAGLGLNLCHAPDAAAMRADHAVPAAALSSFSGTVCGFWARLLEGMLRHYERDVAGVALESVRLRVESALAWLGETVYAEEAAIWGKMAGIESDGSLLLETDNGRISVNSGSIRHVCYR